MKKTAKGLVEYVLAQLGRPYWYGTFGQAASKELYEQKKRQYPKQYTWDYDGITAKVHDCVGLIKAYLWGNGPEDANPVYDLAQDLSANMMRDACKTKGVMETMPEIPGVLVFYNGHVGVYIGNGEVVECRSRKYGVYKSKLKDRPWTSWGYCPFITYEEPEQEKTCTLELPILKKGDKSEVVRTMQWLLIRNGYDMEGYGADASFGGATRRAVERFQVENGLAVTSQCDAATWRKLLGV
ncbi:MAG: peptidoglycan-binding protein [Bacteroidaceae bacterium]|nr:peptidoglycan-binding protein [Bacteroidaceae bacterium]